MNTVRGIRRLGFRKWYERELLQSHAHLVLLLLCLLGALGSAEAFGLHLSMARQALVLVCAVASAGVGAWALRRYLVLLEHAEYLADQAVCPPCGTYARWDLREESADGRLRVQCRRCGHEWHIVL